MIDKIFIKNIGFICNLEVQLTQFHAFIGQNGVGKSTILEYIHLMVDDSQLFKDHDNSIKAYLKPGSFESTKNAWFMSYVQELALFDDFGCKIYPANIPKAVKILKDLSKRIQVIISTHNPLVINEMNPSSVTIVTRDRNGNVCLRLLSETKNFKERIKVYAPGELWLNYTDGEDEHELLGDYECKQS